MLTLINDLNSSKSVVQKQLYSEIGNEIENINDEWQDIVDKARLYAQLNIEIKKENIDVKTSA